MMLRINPGAGLLLMSERSAQIGIFVDDKQRSQPGGASARSGVWLAALTGAIAFSPSRSNARGGLLPGPSSPPRHSERTIRTAVASALDNCPGVRPDPQGEIAVGAGETFHRDNRQPHGREGRNQRMATTKIVDP